MIVKGKIDVITHCSMQTVARNYSETSLKDNELRFIYGSLTHLVNLPAIAKHKDKFFQHGWILMCIYTYILASNEEL